MILTWVFFAGAPETGKSSAARILKQRMHNYNPEHRSTQVSTIQPVADAVMRLFGRPHEMYEDFKKREIYGKTGREWIIRFTEDVLRKDDRAILCRVLIDRMNQWRVLDYKARPFVIVENLGFDFEYWFYRSQISEQPSLFGDNQRMFTVYMRRPGFGFDRDSREDLQHRADWILDHPTDIKKYYDTIVAP